MFRLSRGFGLAEREVQAWLPQPDQAWTAADAERGRTWREANANLAVFGSAMLFASLHSEAWPAPIALFPLALVLGFLAKWTQNLIGPITLHATFNLVAFITLYGSTHYDLIAKGNVETTALRPSVLGSITTSVPASQLPRRK
jgi:hypothetical protein